ncbi:hypothetical protein LAZ67_X000502 [Cordylochernes scorpioides]|uniref:Uncharacterized protein n=1 Tax=Cordylochernes scorpioides TaxID=51811 RepID=A0ABY6LRU6_9ARAC|nr:hypothetical protein LAZ67_X000502 [Cordylochernes scorpioides]
MQRKRYDRRLRRTAFCNKYPEKCSNFSCKIRTGRFCDENQATYQAPRMEYLDEEYNCSHEDLITLGHQRIPLIKGCYSDDNATSAHICRASSFLRYTVHDGLGRVRNCYAINSLITKPSLYLPELEVTRGLCAGLALLLGTLVDLEPNEYFRADRTVSGQVDVHSSYSLVNPFFTGFQIRPGRIYILMLKLGSEKLLKPPYNTQCMDYKELWKINKSGPFNAEAPRMEYLDEEYNCSHEDLITLGHQRIPLIKGCYSDDNATSAHICRASSFLRYTVHDGLGRVRNCYAINSLITKPSLYLPELEVTRGLCAGLALLLGTLVDLEPNEYFRADRTVSGQVDVHSSYSLVNPFFTGFQIRPGRIYILMLKLGECVLDRLRFLPIKKNGSKNLYQILCENEIKCADAFRMLTVAYGEATLDRSNVYRWYKMFS